MTDTTSPAAVLTLPNGDLEVTDSLGRKARLHWSRFHGPIVDAESAVYLGDPEVTKWLLEHLTPRQSQEVAEELSAITVRMGAGTVDLVVGGAITLPDLPPKTIGAIRKIRYDKAQLRLDEQFAEPVWITVDTFGIDIDTRPNSSGQPVVSRAAVADAIARAVRIATPQMPMQIVSAPGLGRLAGIRAELTKRLYPDEVLLVEVKPGQTVLTPAVLAHAETARAVIVDGLGSADARTQEEVTELLLRGARREDALLFVSDTEGQEASLDHPDMLPVVRIAI